MPKPWQMRISHDAGPPYVTPDVRLPDPGWQDRPTWRPITSLELYLPTGHRLVLAGFEAYNFFAEASQPLAGGSARLEALWFCGRRGASVDTWRVARGRIVREVKPCGQEWGGGATRGWQAGLAGKIVSRVVAP